MLTIKVNNLDVAIKSIKDASTKIQQDIENELSAFGLATVNSAKRYAPVDEGPLRNSISFKKEKMKVTITVGVNYAAYVEFGTRRFAAQQVSKLPQDWQTYAAQFKGKGGGNMDEFIQRIMAWVQRKGIGAVKTRSGGNSGSKDSLDAMQQAAYAIALNILQNGIRAHPFLYPAYTDNTPALIENIKKAIDAK